MSDRRDRDHYDRPSWKEIDKKKDSSSHTGGSKKRGGLDDRKVTTGYSQYRSDLDNLFESGEASKLVKEVMSKSAREKAPASKGKKKKGKDVPARQKILRALRAASSSREIEKLLDEFLAKWELPDDIEILTKALGHPDEEIQADALRAISAWLDGHVPRHKSSLQTKVRTLSTRSDDDDVRELAREVNRKL